MRSTLSAATVVLSALQLAHAQTFTDCDPTKKTCPPDAGIGNSKPFFTDFTSVSGSSTPAGWSLADGTSMSYDSNGANFKITSKTGAPTMSTVQYIMFGKVEVYAKASPGTGIVSSFILESDDLDEIDWEWLGATDTSVESNFFGKGNVTTYNRAIYHPLSAAITGWHTYTIDWNKDAIKWSIDGNQVRSLAYSDPLALGGPNFPQTPMKIKMGNWVGCADAAAASNPATQGTCQWAGGPASFDNGASYTMLVKNVTINDYGCGGQYTYSDMTGSYQSIKSSNQGANCGSSGSSSGSSSASGSSSVASSTGATSTASASTSGAVLAQTSSSVASSATGTSSGSGSQATTLATNATSTGGGAGSGGSGSGSGGSGGSGSGSGGASATSSAKPSQVSLSAANEMKPKHKYGAIDLAVMVLGLGLGYLVM